MGIALNPGVLFMVQRMLNKQLSVDLHNSLFDSRSNHYFLMPTVDDIWHHICVTWSNEDGKSLVYFDGVLIKSLTGLRINFTIPSGGILLIGQRQEVLGVNHNRNRMYHGKLAHLNIWSNVFTDSMIVALSKGPGAENGDVVSWANLRTMTHGNVAIEEASNLRLTGERLNTAII